MPEFTVVGPDGLDEEFASFTAARQFAEGQSLSVLLVFGPGGAEHRKAAWFSGNRAWYTSVWGGIRIVNLEQYLGV